MIPLLLRDELVPDHPQLPIPRLLIDGQFEPSVGPPDARTAFAVAYVDTGAPYVIIPHKTHKSGLIRIYQDLGLQPYRLSSMGGVPLLQAMVEVSVRFLVPVPGGYDYFPPQFAPVKAYLLEQNLRPIDRVVIGLDAIRTHFPLFVNATRAFFFEPGDRVQLP